MNIENFRSEINKNGVLKTNKFLVKINPPNSLKGRDTRPIELRCDNIQWPGVSFATLDTPPRAGYGATEVIPYAPIFEDITMTFIVDKNSETHRFFYNWMNTVINMKSIGQSLLQKGAYEVGYKDAYSTDININVYDDQGVEDKNKVMMATLYRAFPRTMPSFDLSWANNDEIMKLNVQFTYTDYFITYPKSQLT